MLRRAAATVAGCALVLSACGSPEPANPIIDATTTPGFLRVVVAGADQVQYETQATDLRILISGEQPGVPVELRLLSVGLLAPIFVREQRGFRVAMDVLGYRGDGEYAFGAGIKPGTAAGVEIPEGIQSNAFVEIYDLETQQIRTVYNRMDGRCDAIVANRGRTGKLECQALRAEEGTGVVTLTMEWRAT